jgi:hypothetical protein
VRCCCPCCPCCPCCRCCCPCRCQAARLALPLLPFGWEAAKLQRQELPYRSDFPSPQRVGACCHPAPSRRCPPPIRRRPDSGCHPRPGPCRQAYWEELVGRAKARELEEHKRRKRAREDLYSALKHDRKVDVDSALDEVAALYKDDPAFRLVGDQGRAGAGGGMGGAAGRGCGGQAGGRCSGRGRRGARRVLRVRLLTLLLPHLVLQVGEEGAREVLEEVQERLRRKDKKKGKKVGVRGCALLCRLACLPGLLGLPGALPPWAPSAAGAPCRLAPAWDPLLAPLRAQPRTGHVAPDGCQRTLPSAGASAACQPCKAARAGMQLCLTAAVARLPPTGRVRL